MAVDVSPKPPQDEVFLGDGLYASFDGFQIRLRAPRTYGDDMSYLEPSVWQALCEFASRCWPPSEAAKRRMLCSACGEQLDKADADNTR